MNYRIPNVEITSCNDLKYRTIKKLLPLSKFEGGGWPKVGVVLTVASGVGGFVFPNVTLNARLNDKVGQTVEG